MSETIFSKILKGEIPSNKVYEDAHVLAFLDVNPVSHGHTLLIPKEPAVTLDQLSDESAAALGRVLPRLCRAVMQATDTKEYNILQNNGAGAHQAVMHVHFHIIPKASEKTGLQIGWPAGKLEEGESLAKKIESALGAQASPKKAPATPSPTKKTSSLPPLQNPRASSTTTIYTDGACSGNPGPGGWAWAVEGGRFASGPDGDTTNQRMELTAAWQAVQSNEGPLLIVSDSTYVVNCFKNRWHVGWIKRDWRNSKNQPVANRDLWEPFIKLVLGRKNVQFRWVKGHSGHPMNDLVDELAVAAGKSGAGETGDRSETT